MATILLIDDENEIRKSVRNFLEDYDYEVIEADGGVRGLELFREKRPDMVLLDLRMPGMDGLEVLEAIRGGHPDTPVVVISGAGILSDVVTALRLGAWDFLFKPIEDMFVLKHAVEMNLDRARLMQESKDYHKRLEVEVERKTNDLTQTNIRLEREIQQRRQTEARYRALVEGIGQPIIQLDVNAMILYCNITAANYIGMQPQDVIGKPLLDIVDHNIADPLIAMLDQTLQENRLVAAEHKFVFNGRPYWFELRFQPVLRADKQLAVIGVGLDITERRISEQETVKTKAQLIAAIEQSPAGILVSDAATNRVIMANKAIYRIFGIKEPDSVGDFLADNDEGPDILAADFTPLELDQMPLHRAVVEGFQTRDQEYLIRRKNGEEAWVDVSAAPIFDDAGNVIAGIAMYLDITRSKNMEAEKLQYFTAFDQTAESIAITDTHGLIEYVNPFYMKISGYTRDEIVGKINLIPGIDIIGKQKYNAIWATLHSGEVWKGMMCSRAKNGETYEEEATIAPVLDSKGAICNYMVVKRDVSEQRRLEMQLQQAQKMEALGTLAGGIAHDFNNILSVIFGYVEMARMTVDEGTQTNDYLKEVLSASQRARELVQQILTFSRQKEQRHQPVIIHLIVKEVINFIRASIPKNINIEHDLDNSLGGVLADPTQLHQVLMNLCTNSYHAMKDSGGTLRVELKHGKPMNPKAFALAESFIMLRVSDTGHGIPPDLLSRIFDPYFTTKNKEEGTGLGLSVVHGIVTSMNGFIEVESVVDEGTTFSLYFPELPVSQVKNTKESIEDLPHGVEHVMLVDDEVQITMLVERFLKKLGYSVESFTCSHKAWERLQDDPDAFDLLFTDMHMPHMTGAHLAQLAMDLRPDLPVILATGYSDVIDDEQAKEIGIKAFFYKPVVYTQLAKVVRKVLDEAKADGAEEIERRR